MSLWLFATRSASCTCCKGYRCRHGSGWKPSKLRALTSWVEQTVHHLSPKGCHLTGKGSCLSLAHRTEALTSAHTSCMNHTSQGEVDWSVLWSCIAATCAALISLEVYALIRPHWMNRHLPAVREGTLLLGVAPVFGLGQMHR